MKRSSTYILPALVLLLLFQLPALADTSQIGSSYTNLATAFYNATGSWQSTLANIASNVFWTLALIELVIVMVPLALKGADLSEFLYAIVKLVLFLGFFYALILHGAVWMSEIVNGFVQSGQQVTGYQSMTVGSILVEGLKTAMAILNTTNASTFNLVTGGIVEALLEAIGAFAVMLCFVVMAVIWAITIFESYFVIGASTLFFALGGSQFTSDYARRTFTAALSIGAKLFVIELMMAVGNNVIQQWINSYSSDSSNNASLVGLVGLVFLFALAVVMVPSVVSRLLGGEGGRGHLSNLMGAVAGAAGAGAAVGAASNLAHAQAGGGAGGGAVPGAAESLASAAGSTTPPASAGPGGGSGASMMDMIVPAGSAVPAMDLGGPMSGAKGAAQRTNSGSSGTSIPSSAPSSGGTSDRPSGGTSGPAPSAGSQAGEQNSTSSASPGGDASSSAASGDQAASLDQTEAGSAPLQNPSGLGGAATSFGSALSHAARTGANLAAHAVIHADKGTGMGSAMAGDMNRKADALTGGTDNTSQGGPSSNAGSGGAIIGNAMDSTEAGRSSAAPAASDIPPGQNANPVSDEG